MVSLYGKTNSRATAIRGVQVDKVLQFFFEVPADLGDSRIIQLRKAISSYLLTLPAAFITPGEEVPGQFDLSKLEERGIPVVRGEEVDAVYEDLTSRRRLLLALIRDDGWQWDDLEAGAYDHLIRSVESDS